ncbi:ATP-binding cassette domain-containing protein [Vibrio sinensis]|uniref:ATP-binding cassette domain-containing protein n=1 Tax=Vibrio sinensis TaxID=2302434 RepID=A0A3A6QQZ3_9VIBR|nr:ATP-binding cassette domain-containing protein [Vibrio sinensis]RJX70225.1 ATP-binding cassette domain-containing protein [Vibrio sinensis]
MLPTIYKPFLTPMNINNFSWKEFSPFNKKNVVVLLGISLFLNILVLAIPIYSLQVFDRVLTSRSFDTLFLISAIVVFLVTIQSALDVLKNYYLQRRATKLDTFASITLYSGINTDTPSNQVSHKDIKELRSFMTSPAFSVVFDILWTPIFIIVMFILHPIVGIVGLSATLLVGGFSFVAHYLKLKKLTNAQLTNMASTYAHDESVTFNETVQSQHLSNGLSQQYHQLTAERIWFEHQLSTSTSTLTSIAKYIRLLLQMVIMAVGATLVIDNAMSAGGIIAGSILMSRALQPLEQLSGALQAWQLALGANKRLNKYFSEIKQLPSTTQFNQVQGALHIDGVSWYPPNASLPLLKNLRLKLEPGNRVAIHGSNGSGKSMLCKIIAGLVKPNTGSIKLDGASINQWSKDQLSQVVGYVPQKIEFLAGTIKQNIAHFDTNIDDDKVIQAAKKIGVHDSIIKLPDGYNTLIGQRGLSLSCGDAQAIAIARALYNQPKLLILDEATSNLDRYKLHQFKQLLLLLAKEKVGVLLVTHNTEIFENMDWVIELESGEIKSAKPVTQAISSSNNDSRNQTKKVHRINNKVVSNA